MNINEKILDKIKKLLSLAASDNEAEAKLAMDSAMRLMAKYSIDATHLENDEQIRMEIIEELYSSPIFARTGVLDSMGYIIAIISPLFGTYGLISVDSYSRDAKAFKLVGFKTNIEITKYALDSLLAQGVIDAKKEFKKHRTLTFGQSFWSGFAVGLNNKFGKMKDYTDGIVVYDAVKKYVDEKSSGKSSANKLSDGIAFNYGVQSGENASIRSGINSNTESGKLLK